MAIKIAPIKRIPVPKSTKSIPNANTANIPPPKTRAIEATQSPTHRRTITTVRITASGIAIGAAKIPRIVNHKALKPPLADFLAPSASFIA